MYNWQYKEWPNFIYRLEEVQSIAIAFAQEMGALNGLLTGLNSALKQEAFVEVLISEAMKTSEIEGEYMSREDVMSSIKKNLGMQGDVVVRDRRVAGVAELITTIRDSAGIELTVEVIMRWHAILMAGFPRINAGKWRMGEEPMQIISGSYGKETVHYEAPPSAVVPKEMEQMINWFNSYEVKESEYIIAALVKTAIIHLYFESIHPFEDGNGRIGRALAEYTLSHTLKSPVLLSISKTIEKNKQVYYDNLKIAQASLDITGWISYFTKVIFEAQKETRELIEFTVRKAKFFDRNRDLLNDRQIKVINRMLEQGIEGFIGGMTAKKYISITRTSKATATRDLQRLQELGIVEQLGHGRSVRYELILS
ncbi:MAG: Fic family protein [Sphingobacterium sp.]